MSLRHSEVICKKSPGVAVGNIALGSVQADSAYISLNQGQLKSLSWPFDRGRPTPCSSRSFSNFV